MKIHEVILFTNRNMMVFDNQGKQMVEYQSKVGWGSDRGEEEKEVILAIHRDKPKVYISKWMEWTHEISVAELACLLGYERWYWDTMMDK